METVFILLTALILDVALGEPPNAGHPIAWLGKLITREMKLAPGKGHGRQLIFGTIMVTVTLGSITTLVFFLVAYLKTVNPWLYVIASGLLLKFTFSLRGLKDAAQEVRNLLKEDKLPEARQSLRSLVSRDTNRLGESQVVAATVSSVAENSTDSFLAPLFYFLLFGLPGAVAYRVINTFDAMIGYRGQWEYLGKFAARLDDIASFIPARLSALIMVLAAWLCRMHPGSAWQIMARDHAKTESPNAGWTMSALAGALEVQLTKAGHYRLGDNHRALTPDIIDGALKVLLVTAIIWSAAIITTKVVYFAIT
jgi:adenosylcobinamide-phosphate synthase